MVKKRSAVEGKEGISLAKRRILFLSLRGGRKSLYKEPAWKIGVRERNFVVVRQRKKG